jgi:hypothetical protein
MTNPNRTDRLTRTSIPTPVAVAVAKVTIKTGCIVGRHRAQWLLDLWESPTALPAERKLGRQALQVAADAAGRSVITLADGTTINNRVFSKASTRRLRDWSQDRNATV